MGSFSKPRRRRQRECRQTKGLMSKIIAVHVPFESLYISLPSSAKQQREMIKFYVFWRTRTTMANFGIFFWKWSLSVHVWPEQIFRPMGVLNRFTELRNSKVEYKFIFLQGVKPAVAVVMLKLPNAAINLSLSFTIFKCEEFMSSIFAPTISTSFGFRDLVKGRLMCIVLCANIVQITMCFLSR